MDTSYGTRPFRAACKKKKHFAAVYIEVSGKISFTQLRGGEERGKHTHTHTRETGISRAKPFPVSKKVSDDIVQCVYSRLIVLYSA